MFDLWALAFQTDLTRVGTFLLARELSVRTYPEIGVPELEAQLAATVEAELEKNVSIINGENA